MIIKSKIKWVTLSLLTLSLLSLVAHLSVTKFSTVDLMQYSAMSGLHADFPNVVEKRFRNKKIWGVVQSLELLQPYANPRSSYPVPNEQSNGFIYAKIFGGFANIRSSICDLVAISRLLNATLVIPEIQESTRSKGISFKFKSFSYLYEEEQFIVSLKNDVIIVKSLPENLKAGRRRSEFPTFRPKSSASPKYYIEEILPKLKKAKVIGLILTDGGCLQSILPPSMAEFQRLRCRVAFHALQFRTDIQILGRRMVERLQGWGQPFLAFHPGLLRDTLAYHGCAELFQDVHTELIQYRRAQMIKRGIVSEELSVDSHLRRENGSCPLMPEEVGVLLRAMGYPPKTIIYLAGSETFGGQRVLIPLRGMFANLVDRTSLCSNKEFSDLVGPETPLPLDLFQMPPAKRDEQLKEEWKKAGPRPRPLPPPPDRPIYRHEKEGWYGWITETDTEPDPSPLDLRMQAHRLLWDALDYIVSVEADAFFSGFNNDGSGWPDFSNLVMGQRLYETASSRTYRPDRKILAELSNITRDNMFHPKHNWTLLVQEHLNKSLGEEGLIRQSLFSKPSSFLSHPLPECSCRVSSAEPPTQVKGNDGRTVYGGEDECPEWMQHGEKAVAFESTGEEGGKVDENEFQEYENDIVQLPESLDSGGKTNVTLVWDQDEEMDPND
ncbi:protein EMBRYO SAC DEVELOPMENT ARREST 30 isoform X1 [Alnus glutinosa]|uniref:protein EMBRYO SAC DEVELOPMENT ARREST 30 isoform X1 n=1 Tax=Alnus glutinosa TaxID=3517 RepID=UPI002D79EB80|nr:protein EMBRYO SAC DEVELOPMENT ARREST 30 isoform X1 [Alnus glutinosa]